MQIKLIMKLWWLTPNAGTCGYDLWKTLKNKINYLEKLHEKVKAMCAQSINHIWQRDSLCSTGTITYAASGWGIGGVCWCLRLCVWWAVDNGHAATIVTMQFYTYGCFSYKNKFAWCQNFTSNSQKIWIIQLNPNISLNKWDCTALVGSISDYTGIQTLNTQCILVINW